MIFIYGLFSTLLAITLFPLILVAFIIKPKFRAGFFQKIGFYPKNNSNKKTIFFHAVSVGEVNAVEQLIKKIKITFPDYNLILSTTTKTGNEVANKKLKDFVSQIIYFPYDLIFSINSFFRKIKPDMIIIAETEIWPMFTFIANLKKTPLILVNGRISPNSHKGYKRLSFFFKKVLSFFTLILMQTEGDVTRITDIGANPDITKVMGNLKFDIEKNLSEDSIEDLKDELKIGNNRLFIAASTHKGEDELVLKVFAELQKKHDDIKLLIAPRHPERYVQVEELLKRFKYSKRSLKGNFAEDDIIMLDTMGELGKIFALGYLAFIGGSFSNTGGHNPLEANIWDIPVISGPTVFNFKDIYKSLASTSAAIIVKNEKEFIDITEKFYSDKKYYDNAVEDCKKIFAVSKGAVNFVIEKVLTDISF